MKLDRLNEYVLATTVVVCGVLLAIMCGRLAGTGDKSMLYLMAGGVIYVITCLTLRLKIWLLIPMFWICSGELNSVPGHLPFRDLVVAGVVAYFLTLKAFKVIRVTPKYSLLDIVLGINLLYILALYMRYPVGVNAFGSDIVGGRPYLEIIFALSGYWVLNQVIITPGQARIFPLLLCAVSAALAVVSTITYLFPSTAPVLGKLYGGVDAESYEREQSGEDDDPNAGDLRAQYLAGVGTTIINLFCSYLSPLTLINPMYIWRFLAMLVAFYFCLKSGHRITLPAMAFTLFASLYFRKGIASTIILGLIAIPPFVLLIAGQGNLYQLPQTAQRTLCMLPGNWDPDVLNNAEGSTEWRVQMWDMMLHDDKYIHDKTFGDGFGFTREQLEERQTSSDQEAFMLINEPHSGPVSTIHVGGYVGLGLFLLLLLGCSIRAWRLIRATKGTPFYPAALFIGIQTIYASFGFVFVFGDFKNDIANMVLSVGILNLLSNGFAAYLKSIEVPTPPPIPKKTIPPLAPIPMPALTMH